MAALNALSINDILCPKEIPIILEKCFNMDAFVMGHHVYKKIWTPSVGEELDTAMEPDNVKDKYAVAVYQKGKRVIIGHLPLGQAGKFAKTIFYFLKACKDNRCKIIVTAKKAVNKNDELGMKVPCRLEFSAEEKYMIILKERLPKLL